MPSLGHVFIVGPAGVSLPLKFNSLYKPGSISSCAASQFKGEFDTAPLVVCSTERNSLWRINKSTVYWRHTVTNPLYEGNEHTLDWGTKGLFPHKLLHLLLYVDPLKGVLAASY